MTRKSKTALFAGTFDPFTIGHASIVERTLKICDKIVIGFGHNMEKEAEDLDDNFDKVRELYSGNDRITVMRYNGLTVDFARECGADFMVRGVRNFSDFEYERNLADINLNISGIETVLIPSLPELSFVSSSMVRELRKYGKDISEYLP